MTNSLSCIAEMNTTLLVNHSSIKIKKREGNGAHGQKVFFYPQALCNDFCLIR